MNFKFELGEIVYHILPDSDPGIVTDITWRMSSNMTWYHVTFSPHTGEIPCRDFELTRTKNIQL